MDHATRVDDIFLGAVIASAVRLGRCLIDLESDGTSHFVRFEDMSNRAAHDVPPDAPDARRSRPPRPRATRRASRSAWAAR